MIESPLILAQEVILPFSPVNLFMVIVGALALAGICWSGLHIIGGLWQRWQNNLIENTESEIQDVLIELPVEKLFQLSTSISSILALVIFFLIAPHPDGWKWEIGLIMGMVIIVLGLLLTRKIVLFLKAKRLEKFNDQLEESLMSMGNALKAGFSINQAVDMVIRQNKNPISIEYRLMRQQTQLGVSFDEALRNMAQRVGSEDFHLVSSAICTARQTGVDLTGVFERLGAVIRERLRIQRRIMTLTAQGRLQGWVLTMLPMVLLAIFYFFVDPEMVENFFGQLLGIFIFLVVVTLQFLGFVVIRKMVNIDI